MREHRPVKPRRKVMRAIFWAAVLASGVFGLIAVWGRGPGLLIGATILGLYDMARHDRIATFGYVLLSVGLLAVTALFIWVPLVR